MKRKKTIMFNVLLPLQIQIQIMWLAVSNGIDKDENKTKNLRLVLVCKKWLDLVRLVHYKEKALCYASKTGNLGTIKLLMETWNVRINTWYDKQVKFTGQNRFRSNHAIEYACKNGHLHVVQYLLNYEHIDPSVNSEYPLRVSCMRGHKHIVFELFNSGRVDPTIDEGKDGCLNWNKTFILQMNALQLSVYQGHIEIFDLFFSSPKIIDYMLDDSSRSNVAIYLLSIAIRKKHIEIAKKILNVPKLDITLENNIVFFTACEVDSLPIVHYLLGDVRMDPDVDLRYRGISEAIKYNHSKVITEIVKEGKIDPSVQNNYIIYYACKIGNLELVVELLKDKRIDPCNPNDMITPLGIACEKGHLEIVKELLKDKRVDPAEMDNIAIRRACTYGNLQVVKELLKDKRVDPSALENECIISASNYGHAEIVEELLKDKRVDPTASDNESIRLACSNGLLDVALKLLDDPRVDPSANNNEIIKNICNGKWSVDFIRRILSYEKVNPSVERNTPLRLACFYKHPSIVKELLKHPRLDISQGGGCYIMSTACFSGCLEIVQELLKDGRIDPTLEDNAALKRALRSGDIVVVSVMMEDERVATSIEEMKTRRFASLELY